MGSEKYKHYIINLLIRMGYCYEVKRIYGIKKIKNEYTSLFIPIYNPDSCINFQGDSFLVNIGLFKMYKRDKLTLRDMEKEVFLINDKLVTMSKSSIQRLSIKIQKFNEDEYILNKFRILEMGIIDCPRDRFEQEIKELERAINESMFYSEICNGVVSTLGKSYKYFKYNAADFGEILKRKRALKKWKAFITKKFESESHEIKVMDGVRRSIREALELKYITKTQQEFNVSGGLWWHTKTLRMYVEDFKKRYNLNELGIANFDKKFIKK